MAWVCVHETFRVALYTRIYTNCMVGHTHPNRRACTCTSTSHMRSVLRWFVSRHFFSRQIFCELLCGRFFVTAAVWTVVLCTVLHGPAAARCGAAVCSYRKKAAFFRYNDREKTTFAKKRRRSRRLPRCRCATRIAAPKRRRRRPSRGGAVRALFEPVILHYSYGNSLLLTHFPPVNKANSYPEMNPQGRRRWRRRC